eukprot:12717365-Ditylum_brightwellii.AAC.1
MVKLTESNLVKICGHVDKEESPKLDRILAGPQVIPPGVVKKCIQNIGFWRDQKKRHIFRQVLMMKNWIDRTDDDESDGDE